MKQSMIQDVKTILENYGYTKYKPNYCKQQLLNMRAGRPFDAFLKNKCHLGYRVYSITYNNIPVVCITLLARTMAYRSAFSNELSKVPRIKYAKDLIHEIGNTLKKHGYTLVNEIDYNKCSLMVYPMPLRFRKDILKYKDGFKEYDVLAIAGQERIGLLNCYMVSSIVYYGDNEPRYILTSCKYGTVTPLNHTYTLRDLILYGYYRIGRSSLTHYQLLSVYWQDKDRSNYLPPIVGFFYSGRDKWTRKKFVRFNRLLMLGKRKTPFIP